MYYFFFTDFISAPEVEKVTGCKSDRKQRKAKRKKGEE